MSIWKHLIEGRPFGRSGKIALRQAKQDHPGESILLPKESIKTVEDRRKKENANAGKVLVSFLIKETDHNREIEHEVEYPSRTAKLVNRIQED